MHPLLTLLWILTGCGGAAGDLTETSGAPAGGPAISGSVGGDLVVPMAPALRAEIDVDVQRGPLPLTVHFDASRSIASRGVASLRWDFGEADGADTESIEGAQVQHTYLRSGDWTVTLTLTDAAGQLDTAAVVIAVEPPDCPIADTVQSLGEVESGALDELSGVVESRRIPGVLWAHNDSGDDPRIFALSSWGRHLGTWTLAGAQAVDWEDIAALTEDGESVLYVGDIGDNDHERTSIVIYRVPEPETPDPALGEPVDETVTAGVITLSYPDGVAYNAESLMGDPLTGDLYLVTKDIKGPAEVFRKPAPHVDGEHAVLEHVASLNFNEAPLSGGATTGADISLAGDRIVIRTYLDTGFLWIRDSAVPLWESLSAEPCPILLPQDPQGESVGFSTDGDGLFTISEGEHQPVNFTALGASD